MLGERIWDSGSLDVSVLCLLWVVLDPEQTQLELLLSGGSDKRVRVWKRKLTEEGLLEGLEMVSMFGVMGGILAFTQNSTSLATSSGILK